jgi:pyruvate,water dikinase
MYVAWLGDPACSDRARVGGKAAQLSQLAAAHRVPPGFALTTEALEHALTSGVRLDGEALPALPPMLLAEVTAAYARLAAMTGVAEPRVAVRSSAIDEDGAGASFAGQHESYLNITGAEAVAQAVVRCWASAYSERALAYRQQQGLAVARVRLAVLVQHLVAADVSAVLFSANPITSSHEEIVITASWGLGESIVGGTVTPDTYVVRKADLALASRQIAEKQRMTLAVPGGTREVEVPRLMRTQPTLTEAQAVEMAELGRRLEAQMGWPVDIEVAYSAGHLSLLQCRPITTLLGAQAREQAIRQLVA